MRMTAVAEPEAVVASLVAAPALLMSFDSGIQAVRDSVQGTFQSFLFSLPLKVALSLAGAAISGSLLAPFKDAIRAGERKRALEGDDFDWNALYFCVFLDLIGDTSFLIPGAGEAEDFLWAPISAFAVSKLFGSTPLAALDFAKELLPFTDALPVCTIGWALKNIYPESAAARLLGLSDGSCNDDTSEKPR